MKELMFRLLWGFIIGSGAFNWLQASDETPNIILVFVDDLGYGDLGCYGQNLIQTPNIDRMAADGIRFTNFYAAAPVCAPSRCSLITGKHAGNAFVRHNMNVLPLGQQPIPDSEITIAELLKKKGYATAAMGKWSLGAPNNSGDPLTQGFDQFYGYYCQCKAHNYYPEMVWRNKDTVRLANEVIPIKVPFIDYPLSYATKKVEYSADLVFNEAMNFIDENSERPFFLYFASALPHSNGEAPVDEKFEVPDWGIYADSSWLPHEKGYASMVTKLDTQMGDMMRKLKTLGIAENTLIIFTSDNGPTKFAKIFESAGELRGRKRDLYEGGIREPFIAYWPGKIKSGLCTVPFAMYDLMPTFAEMVKVKIEHKIDGRSMLPTLLGRKQSNPDFLYWEFYEGKKAPLQAIRQDNWKMIRFFFNEEKKSLVELYNLEKDLKEENNVADVHPKVVKRLIEIMNAENHEYPNRYVDAK